MSDLIERKDLGAAIDNWLAIDRYYHPYSKQKTIPVSELVDIIKQLPSAQPEIVRCKDCKYNPNNPRPYADNDPIETFIQCQFMEPYDFCSKGKRSEE